MFPPPHSLGSTEVKLMFIEFLHYTRQLIYNIYIGTSVLNKLFSTCLFHNPSFPPRSRNYPKSHWGKKNKQNKRVIHVTPVLDIFLFNVVAFIDFEKTSDNKSL